VNLKVNAFWIDKVFILNLPPLAPLARQRQVSAEAAIQKLPATTRTLNVLIPESLAPASDSSTVHSASTLTGATPGDSDKTSDHTPSLYTSRPLAPSENTNVKAIESKYITTKRRYFIIVAIIILILLMSLITMVVILVTRNANQQQSSVMESNDNNNSSTSTTTSNSSQPARGGVEVTNSTTPSPPTLTPLFNSTTTLFADIFQIFGSNNLCASASQFTISPSVHFEPCETLPSDPTLARRHPQAFQANSRGGIFNLQADNRCLSKPTRASRKSETLVFDFCGTASPAEPRSIITYEPSTQTLKSQLTDYCFDLQLISNTAILSNCNPSSPSQQFIFTPTASPSTSTSLIPTHNPSATSNLYLQIQNLGSNQCLHYERIDLQNPGSFFHVIFTNCEDRSNVLGGNQILRVDPTGMWIIPDELLMCVNVSGNIDDIGRPLIVSGWHSYFPILAMMHSS
jgi:hypothetical protein